MHRGDETRRHPRQHRARRAGRRGCDDRGAAVGPNQACRARRIQYRAAAGGAPLDQTAQCDAVGAFGVPHAGGERKSDRGRVAALPKDREGEIEAAVLSSLLPLWEKVAPYSTISATALPQAVVSALPPRSRV